MTDAHLQTITEDEQQAKETGFTPSFLNLHRTQFRARYHVPLMQKDSRLSLVRDLMLGVAHTLAEFTVVDEEQQIIDWVSAELQQFWDCCGITAMTSMDYGYMGAEVIYDVDDEGFLSFKDLRKLSPHIITPLTLEGQLVGIGVGASSTPGEDMTVLGGEKAYWTVHGRQWDRWYGYSRYEGAFEPWLDMIMPGGLLDGRRSYIYRSWIREPPLRHPPGKYKDSVGQDREYAKEALEVLEKLRSGQNVTWPARYDPQTKESLWGFEDVPKLTSAADVIAMVNQGRRELTEGFGCPNEVFEAASTGSGFSGRRIPNEGFRSILHGIAFWAMQDADEQILRPLARMRFGVEPSYRIEMAGFVRSGDEEVRDEDTVTDDSPAQNEQTQNGNGRSNGQQQQRFSFAR